MEEWTRLFPSQKGEIEKTDDDFDNEPNHNYGQFDSGSSSRPAGETEGRCELDGRWEIESSSGGPCFLREMHFFASHSRIAGTCWS